jgi:hypothetical protein
MGSKFGYHWTYINHEVFYIQDNLKAAVDELHEAQISVPEDVIQWFNDLSHS